MLTPKDIEDYITASVLLGGYRELVQGSGGNISVKTGDQLCVKASGRILGETTNNYGYSICSMSALRKELNAGSEDTRHTVIGGEPNSVPSMEAFFHMLPSKWVIHLHPTFLLPYLCNLQWDTMNSEYSYCHIPYTTPGIDLAKAIEAVYTNEKVIFLQNHGVIICADTLQMGCVILDSLVSSYQSSQMNALQLEKLFLFQEYIHHTYDIRNTFKPCSNIRGMNERLFLPITPDIHLFLKGVPLVQESSHEDPYKLLEAYYRMFQHLPTVFKIFGRIFVFGKTYRQCICIEEILESFLEIIHRPNSTHLTTIPIEGANNLSTNPREVHRLTIL